MLKYQVTTLGRSQRRRSHPPVDSLFHNDQRRKDTIPTATATATDPHWGVFGNVTLRRTGRSTSVSSLSSASTSSDSFVEWGTIKIYTSELQADTDYKTLFVSTNTSTDEIVQLVLAKFCRRFRDPNLFYLSMELNTKHEGASVASSLILDGDAKPLELQACHPKEMSKFVLHVRPSFQIRVYDHCLHNTSNYKSLLISNRTTCLETIRLVLKMNKVPYAAEEFNIVLKNIITGARHQLPHDLTLASIENHCNTGAYQLHLKSPTSSLVINRRCLVSSALRTPFLIDEDPFSGLAAELTNFI